MSCFSWRLSSCACFFTSVRSLSTSHWCKGTSALTDSVWHLLHPGSDLTMIQPLWPVFRHVVESPGQPVLNTEPVLWGGLSLLFQRVILLFKFYRDTSSLIFFTTETAALNIFVPDRSFISFPGVSNDSTWASLECYFKPRCCYVYCCLSEQLSNVYCSEGLWGTTQWQYDAITLSSWWFSQRSYSCASCSS